MYDEVREELEACRGRVEALRSHLDVAKKEKRLEALEGRMGADGFWNARKAAAEVVRERKTIETLLRRFRRLETEVEDAEVLYELGEEAQDAASIGEARGKLGAAADATRDLELQLMLGGEEDPLDAIVSIHPGAGGTEAQDWAEMLLRMFLRYVERRGWKAEMLDRQEGDEAGIKSASIEVQGEFAYGYLKAEAGVHRLVRISPYDSSSRRHTSFASVFVYPVVEEADAEEIDEADIKMDVFRASGAGGQHVNKTSSAVRLTHLPTGVVVACQSERSQFQNRAAAMKVLKAKLHALKKQEAAEKMAKITGVKKEIAWGSQIRSYVMQPYRMVKDHRTGQETGNVEAVLDGNLEPFIEAYLSGKKSDKAKAMEVDAGDD
ncbi:MAG: peptide chain release factor 2 [Candidatus Methylomirabilis sp.]|nr:peptide chain release factor 2 [Deltaproteobacteria bacterium]